MSVRIYIAPSIGDGGHPATQVSDTTGPFRSRVSKYLAAGDIHSQTDLPARGLFLSIVDGSATTHTAILADSLITPVTPAAVADMAALAAQLNAPFSSYTLAWRNAAKAKLEGWGINTDWITGTDTLRSVLRAFVKMIHISQRFGLGEGRTGLVEWINANLDTTVSALPLSARNGIGQWMDSVGIDTSWITGTTTVREIQRYIATRLSFPAWHLGGEIL